MSALDSVIVQCPYCWEALDISVDPSVAEQEYVEDCQVCCQPILLRVIFDDNLIPYVEARAENE
ncbi:MULTISPECIES: CPXCG motif-containing cysteine-rich protein [unclassified Marinobacter]|uniref:CPXCG motif-containing cysteine-rich protein n=1 Tax=unclassified Marinobacter TaxID=83889 RepID=UPI001902D6F2|nr:MULTISPECIES: CPXCG motif-containing cysteine-rich protein [unclassified Marinobacter]MBK1850352.1 CPXCG motif-containing cysteine-rich protein [Marinobacter sp. 1-4A]MCK0163659.1 CPXCG motif-containing cysteine-rich protein [Marinobacter sp. S6332]